MGHYVVSTGDQAKKIEAAIKRIRRELKREAGHTTAAMLHGHELTLINAVLESTGFAEEFYRYNPDGGSDA